MARHVCPNCGATVAANEQFCSTCGTFVDYEDDPQSEEEYETFELGAAPPPPAREPVICPSCGADNLPTNRHCEECGARLSQGPLPAAPRPAVQATAGVRAVIAIGGLLLGVIIIALLFQLFSGEPEPSNTTLAAGDTSTTSTTISEPEILDPLDVECSVQGIGSFICENLISGTDALYQVNWVDLEQEGETPTITIRFRSAVAISRIGWHNISNDEVRFQRNYRARSLTISADDSMTDTQFDLQNIPGAQEVVFTSLNTHQLTITINSAWPAQLQDGQVFDELVIDEIEVIGRPATGTTAPTDTSEATDESTPESTDTTEG